MSRSLLLAAFAVCLLCACALPQPASAHSHGHGHAPASAKHDLQSELTSFLESTSNCTSCLSLVAWADTQVNNSASLSALQTALDTQYCPTWGLLYGECTKLVTKLIAALPTLPEKLFKSGLYTPTILCSALGQCPVACCPDNAPTQVHLSFAGQGPDQPEQMTVTWVTLDDTADGLVEFGVVPTALTSSASQTSAISYTQGGWVGSIHSATMVGISPGEAVYYRVGGPNSGWSEVFSFLPLGLNNNLTSPMSFAVLGDMGIEQAFSGGNQDFLEFSVSSSGSQAGVDPLQGGIIHIGDIAYADGYEARWDQYFNELQALGASRPIMTCPGNHEIINNFTSYKDRLSMPESASGSFPGSMYFSYDVGCVHFVSLNSESSLDTPYISPAQLSWLQEDLAKFSQRKAQSKRFETHQDQNSFICSYDQPTFAVVLMHRPVYCSAQQEKRCTSEASYLQGLVEDIFYNNGVDLVFYGHVHAYERMVPMYESQGNANGPTYILNGAGGNREGGPGSWVTPAPAYSAFRGTDVGLGTLTIVNATSLQWQFYLQSDLEAAVKNVAVPTPVDSVFLSARAPTKQ